MSGPKIPRGVLEPPRIGWVRVPLDLAPFFLLFTAGFLFGISIGAILAMIGGMAVAAGVVRKKGDGFTRGWVLWYVASRHHAWRPPERKEERTFEGDV